MNKVSDDVMLLALACADDHQRLITMLIARTEMSLVMVTAKVHVMVLR